MAATTAILVAEALGGVFSHSLALLADAAHMLSDVGAAALGLWAAIVAQRSPDRRKTFGYGRATVLAALTNAAVLFCIAGLLGVSAVGRLRSPHHVDSTIMFFVAAFALAANLALSAALMRGRSQSLNVKGVNAHVLGDAAISAAVVIAAAVIAFAHWALVDPIVSLVATVAVALAAWTLIRDTLNILMEGVPQGVTVDAVEAAVREISPIEAVHDVHVWSLSDRKAAASLHVRVSNRSLEECPSIVASVKAALRERFGIHHATIEVECEDCDDAC